MAVSIMDAFTRTQIVLLSLACLSGTIPHSEAVWFTLPISGTKCVSEELHKNVVVMADYYAVFDAEVSVSSQHHPTITMQVKSPSGKKIHSDNNVTVGQFAFTAVDEGIYIVCFDVQGGLSHTPSTVGLDWRTGIDAKDWKSVAKKEKIQGVELELRKLQALVKSIHDDILWLISFEAEMRETSETTNARVVRFSTMSLAVCISASFLQVWRLKRFFHKKKLI